MRIAPVTSYTALPAHGVTGGGRSSRLPVGQPLVCSATVFEGEGPADRYTRKHELTGTRRGFLMTLRKLAAALFAAAAIATSTIGLSSTAAAHTDSTTGTTGILTSEQARQPSLTAAQMKNAVEPATARSGSAAATLNCAYYYVCGEDSSAASTRA